MTTTKLKLADVLNLEAEINGFTNPQTNEKIINGLLNEKLSLVAKYWLNDLSKKANEIKVDVDKLRDELIKKYGEDDGNGGILVKMYDEVKDEQGNVVVKTINENYIKFDEEYGTLLNNDKEMEHPEITKEDLKMAGKTKDKYKILFKLIKKGA